MLSRHTLSDPVTVLPNAGWLWNVPDLEIAVICFHGNWEVLDPVDDLTLRIDSVKRIELKFIKTLFSLEVQ